VKLLTAALLTVTGVGLVTVHHRKPHHSSSATVVRLVPGRVSRSDVRRPLPGVEKPRRRAPVRRPGPRFTPGGGALNWTALAQCESSGDWHANTGNGFYGGLQFDLQTWFSVGGHGLPSQASNAEQIRRGQILFASRGRAPWPVCGVRL